VAAWQQIAQAQKAPEAVLEVQIENYVNYDYDLLDYTKFSTIPTLTTALPMRPFGRHLALADVVSVNGKAALGTCVYFSRMLGLAPNAIPGQAVADVRRSMLDDFACEFLQGDGTPVGTIMGYGFTHGSAPPGAPLAVTTYNFAIIGGTGAFLGAQGQGGFAGPVPSRVASVYEDASSRRLLGGTSRKFIVHLILGARPEIRGTAAGPAVFHGHDFSPVTAENPARAGEWLVLSATNLGPVRPNLDPGQPFPTWEPGKGYQVNSPIEVMVNGNSAELGSAIGWPGQTNTYRLDVRLPDEASAGMATLGLRAAWITAPEVRIPVVR
jgi:uncharacterized protein (TIGR03437 family)